MKIFRSVFSKMINRLGIRELAVAHSESSRTSYMELFAEIVSGQPLCQQKIPPQTFAWALNTPLVNVLSLNRLLITRSNIYLLVLQQYNLGHHGQLNIKYRHRDPSKNVARETADCTLLLWLLCGIQSHWTEYRRRYYMRCNHGSCRKRIQISVTLFNLVLQGYQGKGVEAGWDQEEGGLCLKTKDQPPTPCNEEALGRKLIQNNFLNST